MTTASRGYVRREVELNLANLIFGFLPDPQGRTPPPRWVMAGFPREPNVTPPRITVHVVGGRTIERVSGNSVLLDELDVQVDIWVSLRDQYTYGGETLKGERLLLDLADRVEEIIRVYRDRLPRVANLLITSYRANDEFMERDLLRHIMTLRVTRYWSKDMAQIHIKFFNESHTYVPTQQIYTLSPPAPYIPWDWWAATGPEKTNVEVRGSAGESPRTFIRETDYTFYASEGTGGYPVIQFGIGGTNPDPYSEFSVDYVMMR